MSLKKLLNTLKIWIKSIFVKEKDIESTIQVPLVNNISNVNPYGLVDKWYKIGFISCDIDNLPLAKLYELIAIRLISNYDFSFSHEYEKIIFPITYKLFLKYEKLINSFTDDMLCGLSEEIITDIIGRYNIPPNATTEELGWICYYYENNHNITRLNQYMNILSSRVFENKYLSKKIT